MAVTASIYSKFLSSLANKLIDFDSDTIKIMLTTSSYTPDLDAHDFKDDVTNEVSGTGYTATGATLSSCSIATTAANSWGTSRANSTAYALGYIVRPATGNTYVYMALTAGTTAGSIPTYPTTFGGTVTDGGVTWMNVGHGVLTLDAADPSWTTSTITARRAVIYDATPGSDATRPLIALIDFGADVSSTASTFSITFDANGIVNIPVP
jgi:hypothetical protein